MNSEFFTASRVAGLLLLLSPLLMLVGVGVIAVQGKLGGMAAAFGGVGLQAGDASGLRIIARFAIPAQITQLAGFAYLTMLLYEAGDRGPALAALSLVVLSAAVAAVEGTFQASVTVWAAKEAVRTGVTPELYEPLRNWANGDVQLVYMSAFLTAMLLFSWSALRTALFPSWMAWVALGSSLISIPLYFLVFGAPLMIIVFPLLYGVGLLLGS